MPLKQVNISQLRLGLKYLRSLTQLRLGQNILLLQRSSGKTLSFEPSRLPFIQVNIPQPRPRPKYQQRLKGDTSQKGELVKEPVRRDAIVKIVPIYVLAIGILVLFARFS